ncbi:MAG: hypothetical protein U0441_00070 [Polyangiaceae bacterium]
MAPRLVVSLHVRLGGQALAGYLRRALDAKKRAEALGATLTAWGADACAFDFAPEEMEEAIELAGVAFEDAGGDARFSAGVAYGPLTRLGISGSLAMLAWGEALLVATNLARAAEPGEVLVDAACPHHVRHALRVIGERLVGEPPSPALVLDARQPMRPDTLVDGLGGDGDHKVVVTVPPLPPILGLARELLERPLIPREKRPSEPPPTLRGEPLGDTIDTEISYDADLVPSDAAPTTITGVEIPNDADRLTDTTVDAPGAGAASEPASSAGAAASSDAAPSSDLAPRSSDPGATGEQRIAVAPPPPPSVVPPPRLPPARMAPSVPPPSLTSSREMPSGPPLAASRISWPGSSEEYSELTAAARQALLKGNVSELERLSDELRSRGEHGDLADRMAGFVAWNRGAKAEGLRKLRAAADAETRPAHRVRALLAYGVALAASGRTDAALLAALGAIARAREVSDRQGEHVCARFLARLSAAAGYERAARTWAEIADDVGAART